MVAQAHRITQAFYRQRAFLDTGYPVKICHRPQADNQQVIFEFMLMTLEPMRHEHFLPAKIDMIDFTGKEVNTPQHSADWIHNRREVQVACRDLVKHRREQEEVIATDQHDLDRIANEL